MTGLGYKFVCPVQAADGQEQSGTTHSSDVSDNDASPDRRPKRTIVAPAVAILAVVAVGIGVYTWFRNRPEAAKLEGWPQSLAVIPFQAGASDEQLELLADGIPGSLSDRLSETP